MIFTLLSLTTEGLVQAIQALYENSSSAVLLNSQLGEFFKTTVSVRQGCILSPILFNLFLESIMQETLHTKLLCISYMDHKTSDWKKSKINFLVVVGPQEPLLATVKRRKLVWFGHVLCHNSLSKPFFKASWRVNNVVVSRGNAGWTSRSRHPCPYPNCLQGPPAEKTGKGSLLNCPSCPPNDPIGQGVELN